MFLNLEVPLAEGGGIRLSGVNITHSYFKRIWENGLKISVCDKCGAKYKYLNSKGLEFIPFMEAKKSKYRKPVLLHFP